MIKKNKSSTSKATKSTKQKNSEQDIIDIELAPVTKKRFRLDGDNNRVIELDTSDLNIAIRLEEVYKKLLELTNQASSKLAEMEQDDESERDAVTQFLKDLDTEMRGLINYLFDSDVADKAAPTGSLYDPINGKFRFEYVIERLANLYETKFSKEYELMQKRMSKHTGKYIRKNS